MAIKDVILGYAKGDKGDRGPQGEKGATGATGPKGEPGNIADAQITDTEGLDVAKGQKTTAQKLLDAIANRIVTKLVTNDALTKKLADYMLKGMMSNTNVNNTGTVPTSALMYSMFEQINSDFKAKDAFLEIGQVERGAYIYLRNKVTNNLLMLRLNEDDKKLVFNSEIDGQWGTETELVTKSDMKVLKKTDVQFSDGFAEISFPGLTYDSAVCINQEYKSSAGVQNLVFTAQVRPNELIIYARNANDGSSYNGSIHIIAIAIG